MNYSLSEISVICNGELSGTDRLVTSVAVDSRNAYSGSGTLFFALHGAHHDGHNYIPLLYGRGVRAFVVEELPDVAGFSDAGFVKVGNSLDALQALAADYRSRFAGTVVGITGSNGKTIVKEWIAALAPDGVKLFRSPKSYNSQTGVPLSLLMMKGDEKVAVIEAGISEPGEMSRLERIIKPDIGIITTIGDAHQENFGGLEEKLTEKLKLFTGARKVIYNSAYREIENMLKGRDTADIAVVEGLDGHFQDAASRENAASAIMLWRVLGHEVPADRLAKLSPVAMRLEMKEGVGGSLIVNDFYNSDINSLAIALDYLRSVAGDRPMTLVISDILQSGYPENELYAKVAEMAAAAGISQIVGIGSRISFFSELFPASTGFYPDTDNFLSALRRDDVVGRALLLKGNRRVRFERIARILEQKSHTTTLEIDLDAMIHNLNTYRDIIPAGTKVMAMVKASGYGNGSAEVASMLQHQGVDYLAVAFADEGAALRERGIMMPIVVLNADDGSFETMIDYGLEPEIYGFASLEAFCSELRRRGERDYPVHIKIDSGMHRLGFMEGDIDALIGILQNDSQLIKVGSIFSHLAASDEPRQDGFTRSQIALFDRASRKIIDSLPYVPLRHIANSAAVERLPESMFDMVRIGIGMYGIGEVSGNELLPVSTLHSRIVQVKDIPAGDTVGYGREGLVGRPSRIAVVPVGYADGFDRRLGNGRWSVLINGHEAPTIGRISMDTCAVDVTGLDVTEGDDVVIFGSRKGHTVADMAAVLGTIPYEIMTGVSSRVKRIFIKE